MIPESIFHAPCQQRLQRTSQSRPWCREHTGGPARPPENSANQEGEVFGGTRFGESRHGVDEVAAQGSRQSVREAYRRFRFIEGIVIPRGRRIWMRWGEMRWVGLIARTLLRLILHICLYLYVGLVMSTVMYCDRLRGSVWHYGYWCIFFLFFSQSNDIVSSIGIIII